MFKILEKQALSPVIKQMVISAPYVAKKCQPGQFIILRTCEEGERIPLTIADFDRELGTIVIVFQEVGKTTKQLGMMEVGDCLRDFAGPLGVPSHIENLGTVICVGGGVGVAPVFPIARALKEVGNNVIGIMGARTKELVFWEDKMRLACSELFVTTDDGSYVRKGFVTDVLKSIIDDRGKDQIGMALAIGPQPMMRACCNLTREYGIPTIVSLNSLMVDGTGMCGSCRVSVGGETKFACVDGPEFDGHKVDFDELARRNVFFLEKEKTTLERFEKSLAGGNNGCRCGGGH